MLRDYVRFNQNMLVAFAVSLPLSALAAEALSAQESHLNVTYTTMVDYAAYLGTFGLMFYVTNRHRYRPDATGVRRVDPRSDLKKILATLGVGEVIYGAARWVIQYYLLDVWQYEPYASSIVAQAVAVIIYVIVINLGVRATKLYADRED